MKITINMNIDFDKRLGDFTIEELFQCLNYMVSKSNQSQQYEYGIKGIAKILGCSIRKAKYLKASGYIDDALIQNGRTLLVDRRKLLDIFKE